MIAIRAGLILILVVLWSAPLILIQAVLLRLRAGNAQAIPRLWHRGILKLLNLKADQIGVIAGPSPILFAANHVSWLDAIVLGSLINGSFVVKHEVAEWPVLGLLAKLQRTLFIERRWRRTKDDRDLMIERLREGSNLFTFPEGTSSDGFRVLPFKSAFFVLAAAQHRGRPLLVQPVSIGYRKLNHMPVARRTMPVFAWVGDENFVRHLWRYLQAGPGEVVVEFHAPVTLDQFPSRKELAQHCRTVIMQGINDIHGGRGQGRRAVPPHALSDGAQPSNSQSAQAAPTTLAQAPTSLAHT
jgi:1-acyl-sn-glycerol-3-phosphate acyltransferase